LAKAIGEPHVTRERERERERENFVAFMDHRVWRKRSVESIAMLG
jgi:hypothetical protein